MSASSKLPTADRRDGAERLLVQDLHLRRHVGEDGRLDEPPTVEIGRPAAAGRHLRALLPGAGQHTLVPISLPVRGQRPHIHQIEAVADAKLAGFRHQLLDERVVNGLVHVESLRRGADLAAIEIRGKGGAPCGYIERS